MKYFYLFILGRQGPCKLGRNPCEPGKECVNYALSDNSKQVICQCPVGRTRGVDCIEGSYLNIFSLKLQIVEFQNRAIFIVDYRN